MPKTIAKKAAKPTKKPAKSGKAKTDIFKKKDLKVWNSPQNAPEELSLIPLNNMDLRYTATMMKQFAADLELLMDARQLNDNGEYASAVGDGARQKLRDILEFLTDKKVI